MRLTPSEARGLMNNGWQVLRGAVSQRQVQAARQLIMQGHGRRISDREMSASPHYSGSHTLHDLLYASCLWKTLEDCLYEGRLHTTAPQIATVWPEPYDVMPPLVPHLDGITYAEGDRPGGIETFSAIVGIFLTECQNTHSGTLWVWPQALRNSSLRKMLPADVCRLDYPHGCPPDVGEPVPVLVMPGDAVLMNYALPHTAAPNFGPDPRLAVYFRIRAHNHWPDWSFTEPWRDWVGLRHFLQD